MSKIGTHSNPTRDRALTSRQREVIALMARGYTNARIAETLGISLDGAKFHVGEILARLGASSREEAVAVWKAETSLAARLHRGLFGLALWKSALVMTAIGAGTAGTILGVALMRTWDGDDSAGKAAPVEATPSPVSATGTEPAGRTVVEKFVPAAWAIPASDLGVTCFAASIASPRADARRCIGDQVIFDPCFAVTTKSVVCESNPAAGSAGVERLVSGPNAVSTESPAAEAPAWALLLADGSSCLRLTGSRGTVNGAVTTFRCDDGSWLLGEPTHGTVWTVDKVAPSTGSPVVATSVTKAWW